MSRKLPEDYPIDALAVEVERRRKLPGHHQYSYGKLVADTSLQERKQIAEAYKRDRRDRDPATAEIYTEPDDREDIRKASRKNRQAGSDPAC